MYSYYIEHNPPPDKIFVFGSNLSGVHGAGAAKYARYFCGAIIGQPVGLQGTSYAIPTRGKYLGKHHGGARFEPIEHRQVVAYIHEFVQFTKQTEHEFYVTALGTQLAGWTDAEIAPYFDGAQRCTFPIKWRRYLEQWVPDPRDAFS